MEVLLDNIVSLACMVGLMCGSAFFSGSETALFCLSRTDLAHYGTGDSVPLIIRVLTRRPGQLLAAILFGNMVVNVLFFCSGAVLAADIGHAYGAWAEAVTGLVVLLSVILFGEILPKAVGVSMAPRVAALSMPVLAVWFRLSTPVRWLLTWLSSHLEPADDPEHERLVTVNELKMLLDMTEPNKDFGARERELIEDIVNLPDIRIKEVMVPRVDVVLCPVTLSASEVLAAAADQRLDRVLIYEGREDDLVGMVRTADLFLANGAGTDLRGFLQPLAYVPETKRADDMLRQFLKEGIPLAVAVDEYGGFEGIVTIEDLLEEVVGPFEGPGQDVESLDEYHYRVSGQLPIREWRELFTGALPEQLVHSPILDTINGLVTSLLGRIPRPGDQVHLHNLRFTVEGVTRRRIETVVVELIDELDEVAE